MSSLRRTVDGWMGDVLYNKLGDEPCIDLSWNLLRDVVSQQLFGSEFVPVPFIESASYFNQLFVFIKKQNLLSTLGIRPPTYKVIGNLDYLVNRDVSTWVPRFDFSPWDIADGHNMYREYNLRVISNQPGVTKSLEFRAVEAHIRSVPPPVPGSVAIHRNLVAEIKRVKTLYVITDVVLASFVKLTVRIGEKFKEFLYDRDLPIGFKYKKYKLRNSGLFVAELDTVIKFFEREAVWLRPEPQPIPSMPMWDYMRRRYQSGSRRKIRNNLTIPGPEETADINARRPHRQEGGVLRIERPIVNGGVFRATDVIHAGNNDEDFWRNQVLQRSVSHQSIRRSVSMETQRGSQ